MADLSTPNCIRCQQPLPEGSGYCVACGCANEGQLDEKVVTIHKQREWRATWERLCRSFPRLRYLEDLQNWLRYLAERK
jgi:hypothetical protein